MGIKIANRIVGKGQPVFVVAEACDNHLGNMATAKKMIKNAMLAGADCIKFQHHLPDEEMLPNIPMSDNFREPLYEFLKKYTLSIDQHKELLNYCKDVGIIYLCTPFSYKAACELKEICVNSFKIGSGEMTDITSLKAISALGNSMIISTGMSTLDEVKRTYLAMKDWGVLFAFTHCVSEYPPNYEDMNLRVIKTLMAEFTDIVIGHSDHTPDNFTSFAAVALGAKIIEKHVILDKNIPGPDQSVSIDMNDLADLVEGIRKIEASMGCEKKVHEKEKQIRKWAFRSIVTTQDIPAGSVLTQEMLWTKRPGTGIPSCEMPSIIGKKVNKSLKANTLLQSEDIGKK